MPRTFSQQLARIVKRGIELPQIAALDGLERILSSPSTPRWPPIFIIGAPRTGSTLLYELLTNRYALAYIDNFMARRVRQMRARALVSRWRHDNRPHGHFSSNHGQTPGSNGPNECGAFWYQWFPRDPPYSPPGTLSEAQIQQLQRAVAGIEHATGRPVVFKNLFCSLRIGVLAEAFPEARFIWCRRDVAAVARSLLRGRHARFGDYETWWSVKPPGYEKLAQLPPAEQVVGQVIETERLIEEDLARHVREDRVMRCEYDRLCQQPRAVLSDCRSWLQDAAIPVADRGEIPASFSVSRAELAEPLATQVAQAVTRYDEGDESIDQPEQ